MNETPAQPDDRKARFWEKPFLEIFAQIGVITKAAELVGVSRMTVWRHRATDQAFARAFDDAQEQAADNLEAEARRRAVEGVDEPQFYKGEVCGYVKRYDSRLLEFLLKGMRPEKYRERFTVAPGELDRLIEHELQKAREHSTEDPTTDQAAEADSVM